MKKNRLQDKFLEELRQLPIIAAVCEKIDLSRNSIYQWRNKDPEFRRKMDEALAEGEARIIEIAETKMLSLIQDGHWPAVSFLLSRRSSKYKERLEVSGALTTSDDNLTPEQEVLVRKALEFGFSKPKKK